MLPSTAVSLTLQRDSGLLAVVCDDMVVRIIDIETKKIVVRARKRLHDGLVMHPNSMPSAAQQRSTGGKGTRCPRMFIYDVKSKPYYKGSLETPLEAYHYDMQA